MMKILGMVVGSVVILNGLGMFGVRTIPFTGINVSKVQFLPEWN